MTEMRRMDQSTSYGVQIAPLSPRTRQEFAFRGLNPEKIEQSHNAHWSATGHVTAALQEQGIHYDLVTATRGGESDLPFPYTYYDAIIACGGDGTFLKAASEIGGPEIPIIGVNTDPRTSKGALCRVPIYADGGSNQFRKIILRLLSGDCMWNVLSRIRVSLEPHVPQQPKLQRSLTADHLGEDSRQLGNDAGVSLDKFALNEVFFAERNVAHPIQHEIIINDDTANADVQLSSGVLISSGTGSTAWMANATHTDHSIVEAILEAAGVDGVDADSVEEMVEKLNGDTSFPGTSPLLRYFVREIVSNGLRKACVHRGGLVRKLTLRSKGWDPTMTLDGIFTYPLPAGQRAHFATDPAAGLLVCSFI